MMDVTYRTVGIVVNAPDVFEREDFQKWLNDPSVHVATWHVKGTKPNEYSDVLVLVDSNHEGDSSDMPEDIWRAICDTVYKTFCDGEPNLWLLPEPAPVVVRLTNLAD